MKKLLALVSVFALMLTLASCGEEPAETSSAAPTTAPTTAPVATIEPIATPTPAPAGPANLALEATAFDMNEGLKNGDDGWYDYYDRESASESLANLINDGDLASNGWQPIGTDGDDATPVTYNNDKKEGFFEETTTADDGTEKVTKKYNLHEGSEKIPENWYFSNDEKTEIREQAVYEKGKVFAGVRFAEAVKTDCVVLTWENNSRPLAYEDGGFYLEYTADGEKWQKLEAAIAREDVEGVNTTDTAEFEALEVTGIRVVSLHCTNKWGTKLYELQVFEAEEEAPAEEVAE